MNGLILSISLCVLCAATLSVAKPTSATHQRHRSVLNECRVDLQNVTLTLLLDCVRDKSLLYLDRVTSTGTIDLLGEGAVKLVRRNDTEYAGLSLFPGQQKLQDATNNSTWAAHVVNKLGHLLQTHVLQIDLISPANNPGFSAGRARRRNQMMPMMMFGLAAIGMVVIPIGFQFLSMFAGKAVLLSKLALMLASLNGLKRLSHSGLSYGFYTAPENPYMPPIHPRPMWGDQPRTHQ